MWIIAINGRYPITDQGALDELNHYQTPHGKSKASISLCRSNSDQRTYLKYICSIFYQFRPIVSHIEVSLPNKPPIPKNIGGKGLKILIDNS